MYLKRLLKVFEEMFDIEKDGIETESVLEDIGIDDVTVVDLALALESDFDIDIPEEIYEDWKTVGDIVEFIENEA